MPVGKMRVRSDFDGVCKGAMTERLVTVQSLSQPDDAPITTLNCGDDPPGNGFWIVRQSRAAIEEAFVKASKQNRVLIGEQESMLKPGKGSRYVLVLQ